MLAAAVAELAHADGVIAAAAPCDFAPDSPRAGKIPRDAAGLALQLRASPDVIATLASVGRRADADRTPPRWFVAFALEPGGDAVRACRKITAKHCDLIVVNDIAAIDSSTTAVAVYDAYHTCVGERRGTKPAVAAWLIRLIERQLMA